MPDMAQAVAELYALMPDAFTAARNTLAAEAAKAGDKELGKALRALPKPSAGAWLVNMLAQHRPELISEVLELGAVLREAQDDMDQQQLRRLSAERQRLLRSAARDARSLAEELGRPVSAAVGAEVEQTLWAAMTDADAAAAAASGQLVRTLEANGWDPVSVDGSVADPSSIRPLSASGGMQRTRAAKSGSGSSGKQSTKRKAAGTAAAARTLRTAKASLADAQRDAEEAEEALRVAQDEIDAVSAHRDELIDQIDDLRDQIRELEHEVAATDRRAGTLERTRDGARRTARAARRAVEKAQTKLESLGQDSADAGR